MVSPIKTDYDMPDILPLSDVILNRNALRKAFKSEQNESIFQLTDDENVDNLDNKGCFKMEDENFNIIFLSNMAEKERDDEIL